MSGDAEPAAGPSDRSSRALAAAEQAGLRHEVVPLPSAEAAREVTGYERGTITPLGSTRPWPVVVDASVSGRVSVGGDAHGVALTMEADELVDALRATVADVTREVG